MDVDEPTARRNDLSRFRVWLRTADLCRIPSRRFLFVEEPPTAPAAAAGRSRARTLRYPITIRRVADAVTDPAPSSFPPSPPPPPPPPLYPPSPSSGDDHGRDPSSGGRWQGGTASSSHGGLCGGASVEGCQRQRPLDQPPTRAAAVDEPPALRIQIPTRDDEEVGLTADDTPCAAASQSTPTQLVRGHALTGRSPPERMRGDSPAECAPVQR